MKYVASCLIKRFALRASQWLRANCSGKDSGKPKVIPKVGTFQFCGR